MWPARCRRMASVPAGSLNTVCHWPNGTGTTRARICPSTRSMRRASRVKPILSASSRISGSISAEGGEHRIGPSKPAASRCGMRPTWSIWTWVTMSARMCARGKSIANASAPLRPAASSPWKMPQSTRTPAFAPPGPCRVSSWQEPVTPVTAPWWMRVSMGAGCWLMFAKSGVLSCGTFIRWSKPA